MTDIVATIQGEQDRIIPPRASIVLIVQGGPGTGKTAVALHRGRVPALQRTATGSGAPACSCVGPSPAFLIDYIEQVLPSLGETGVVMASLGSLYRACTRTMHDHGDVPPR